MPRHSWMISGALLFLFGCGEPKATKTSNEGRPKLPTASVQARLAYRSDQLLALNTAKAEKEYGKILAHPWVKQQKGLTHVTHAMVDDIQSLSNGHEELNKYRAKANLPTTTLEQESASIISTIQEIQASLIPLHLRFPADRYSVLNIPPTRMDLYHTPLPFEIYKRVEWGQTDTGIPYFLDVRVFNLAQLQSKTGRDAAIEAIINWHVNLLQGGDKAFKAYQTGDALVLFGHGSRDRNHYDGGHGFASDDRGVYLAFFSDGKHLFVLHADAPWKNIEPQRNEFIEVLSRPIVPWTQPISAFKFTS